MAAEVRLTVKVIDTELKTLVSEIAKIESKTINLRLNGTYTKQAVDGIDSINDAMQVTIEKTESVMLAEQKTAQVKSDNYRKSKAQVQETTRTELNAQAKIRAEEEKTARTKSDNTRRNKAEKEATARAELSSQAKIQAEEEKTAQAKERTAQTEERTKQAAERTAQAQEKTRQAEERTAQEAMKLERAQLKTAKASESMVASLLKAKAIQFVAQSITNGFREALQTIKEVDSELASIQKVTDFSDAQMESIARSAYSTASKYGVNAPDYLESVAAFAKAGYADLSDELGELATKTQLVGDTTADTANKFLLSVDAAWKMHGSVDELSSVLDKANAVENNFATSIDKIAEGMPNLASVAAMANVSVEETIAALGTDTAVTQEAGKKASTALRSLFLNIVGDTNTMFEDETGEFVKWTKDETEVLGGLLKKYAGDVVDAAEATGSIINPMEAIVALGKAYNEGLLTEVELETTLSSLGGKLRTNQLVALVQNYEMYEKMLATMESSAGSADKEIEIMLDTWESKANILKNTWTEFISKAFSADIAKGFLTTLTNILNALGDARVVIAAIVALVVAAKLPNILGFFKDLGGLLKATFTTLKNIFEFLKAGGSLTDLIGSLGVVKLAIVGVTAAITAGIIAYNKYMQNLEKTSEELQKSSEESLNEYQSIDRLRQKYSEAEDAYKNGTITKEAFAKVTEEVTNALGLEASEAANLRTELERLSEQERAEAVKSANMAINAIATEVTGKNKFGNAYLDSSLRNNGFYEAGNGADKMAAAEKALADLEARYNALNEKIASGNDGFGEATIEVERVRTAYEYLKEQVEEYNRQQEILAILNGEVAESTEDGADALGNLADGYDDVAGEAEKAKTAIEKFNEATESELDDKFKQYADAYKKFLEDWENGFKGSNTVKAASELFFTDEQINELRSKGIDVGEVLANDFYKAIFESEGEDRGTVFANKLYEMFGGDLAKMGAASFEMTDAGLKMTIEDVDKLSDALYQLAGLGFDSEFLGSWLESLGIFTSELEISASGLMEMAAGFNAVNESGIINFKEVIAGLVASGETTTAIWDIVDALIAASNAGEIDLDFDTSNVEEARKSAGEMLSTILEGQKDVTDEPTVINVDTAQVKAAHSSLDKLRTSARIPIIQNVIVKMQSLMAKNAKGTNNFVGGLSVVNEEGAELIKEGNSMRIAGEGKPTITWIQPGAAILNASNTRSMLGGLDESMFYGIGVNAYASGGGSAAELKSELNALRKATSSSSTATKSKATKADAVINKAISTVSKASTYVIPASAGNVSSSSSSGGGGGSSYSGVGGGGGSSSSSSSSTDAQLEKLKDAVSLLKSELDLIEAQNGSVKDQINKNKEIQNALQNEIDYLKSIGGDQEEINKLTTEWYKINDDISKLMKGMFDDLSDAADREIKTLNESRDAELDVLDAQIEAMKKEREAKSEQLDYEEKILAVQEAQANLANAQADRTVRYFNAATGQWEWGANAKNVQSAQEALDKAIQDLADYEDQMAFDAAIAEIEAQKEAITASYETLENGWQEIIDSLEEPTESMEEVLDRIAKNSMPEMEDTINKLNVLLEKFGYRIGGTSGGTFDSGGVLNGLGGIKATSSDEIILPPDVSSRMLMPNASSNFIQRLNELRFMYGAGRGSTGSVGNSIGSMHNGNIYNFAGISLSEAQARSTSVYELVRLSQNLPTYSAM